MLDSPLYSVPVGKTKGQKIQHLQQVTTCCNMLFAHLWIYTKNHVVLLTNLNLLPIKKMWSGISGSTPKSWPNSDPSERFLSHPGTFLGLGICCSDPILPGVTNDHLDKTYSLLESRLWNIHEYTYWFKRPPEKNRCIPYHPCMAQLLIFGTFFWLMLVNVCT